MWNPKVLEAWYTLMAEASRGTSEAQDAFKSLSEMPATPEAYNQWVKQFMPGAASSVSFQPDTFDEQMENWWRMMGMVPRPRYLELLERCDTLERKLSKAEKTIEALRRKMGTQDQQEEETKKVLDTWNTIMGETLKAQTEWMKAWTAVDEKPTDKEEPHQDDPRQNESDP
jgi:uncharacterized coiled-coil protein SlyX